MKKEHFEILDKGVKFWNDWREENPKINPDLSGATLSLTQPAFRSVKKEFIPKNYSNINFSKTDLSNTIINGANLSFANLEKAKFKVADLRRANFSFANLTGASFHRANLTLANFYSAEMKDSFFWETVLARTNFDRAKNLHKSKHGGPSIIDHRTFIKSREIPNEFLKKIGLPNQLINAFESFVESRNDKSCFISHSTKDVVFVEKLYQDLQDKNVRCWYAPEDLDYGDKIRDEIDKAIDDFDKLLIILSKNSINSYWVEDEIEAAIDYEIKKGKVVLMPIMIEEDVLQSEKPWFKKIKRSRNIGDFSNWKKTEEYKKKLERLIKAINK